MRDGEGREIDFRNTVIALTSNLGSGPLLKALEAQPERPPIESLREGLRPILSKHFQPALLARMRVVPFYPLSPEALAEVAQMRLDRVADRLRRVHGVELEVAPEALDAIVARGARSDTGARALDAVVQRTVQPQAARLAAGGARGRGAAVGPAPGRGRRRRAGGAGRRRRAGDARRYGRRGRGARWPPRPRAL